MECAGGRGHALSAARIPGRARTSRTASGATSGWTPSHLTLPDARTPARRDAAVPQAPLVGRVRVRFRVGAGVRAPRPALLPEADCRACRSRPRPDRACWRATVRKRRRLRRELHARRRSSCARDEALSSLHVLFPDTPQARRAAARRAAAAPRLPVSLAQPRLRDFERSSATSPPRSARRPDASGAACTKPASRSRRSPAARSTGALWQRIYALSRRHVPASRPHAVSERGLLPRSGRSDCPSSVVVQLALRRRAVRSRRRSASAARDTLYGRYWGASADHHSLHFETCYYQGIDYCIRNGLQHFEPGTQGEHKVSRGFEPELHVVGALDRRRAVRACDRRIPASASAQAVDAVCGATSRAHVPYKEPTPLADVASADRSHELDRLARATMTRPAFPAGERAR